MFSLLQFTPTKNGWELESQTFVRRAVYRNGGWEGEQGWKQDFTKKPPAWTPFAKQPAPRPRAARVFLKRAA